MGGCQHAQVRRPDLTGTLHILYLALINCT